MVIKFGNNVSKFITSIGPQTTKEKGKFQIDLEDDAVQNMLISYAGEKRFPDKITPYMPPPVKQAEVEEVIEKTPEELFEEATIIKKSSALKNAQIATIASAALLAYGVTAGSHDDVAIMSSFALAGLAGYQVVWGVAPALRKLHGCNMFPILISSTMFLLIFHFRFSIDGSYKCNFGYDCNWRNASSRRRQQRDWRAYP